MHGNLLCFLMNGNKAKAKIKHKVKKDRNLKMQTTGWKRKISESKWQKTRL